MLSEYGRSGVNKVARPIASALLRLGATPNAITLTGLTFTCAAALGCLATGHLVLGAVLIAVFTLFDLLDGAVARAGGGGSSYGALVDAVSDRVADGAIFAALIWWVVTTEPDNRPLLVVLLIAVVFSQVVSYSRARADAGGLSTPGGLMERADRLVITLLGVLLEGLGVPWALEVAVTVVALGSVVTVVQRVLGGRADFLRHRADGRQPPTDAGTRDRGVDG